MTRLEHALALARQGLLILPIMPGKKRPYASESWAGIMTTDETIIRGWFESRPDMNYGVCPGKNAVILDPDIDVKKGKDGLAALKLMEDEHFEEPITGETLTVKSPRGGQHLYLLTPYSISNSSARLAIGIDVRGYGGYVVGPGSHTVDCPEENTAEGTYEIVCDKPLMAAPQWTLDSLSAALERHKDAGQPPPQGWDQPAAIESVLTVLRQQTEWPVEGQHGDIATYELIAILKDYGVSEAKGHELLNTPIYDDDESWNDRCSPAWSDSELETKFENVYQYGLLPPGSKGGLLAAMPDYAAQAVEEAAQAAIDAFVCTLDAYTFDGDAFFERKVKQEFVIREWLLAHGVTALLAVRGTGKTVNMIDMACRISCDMDWHGVPVKPGFAVIYICGEDDVGLQQHYKAWVKKHGRKPDPKRIHFTTITPNLMQEPDVAAWAEHLKRKLKGQRAVIFLDTWQRATSYASQNDDKEMQCAAANVEALAKALNACAVIAFHPPKNNPDTIMGSSIVENNTVGIWTVKKHSDMVHRVLRCARLKAKGEGNEAKFLFQAVGIDEVDDFGQEATGLVPEMIGDAKTGNIAYAEGDINKNAVTIYATILADLLMDYTEDLQAQKIKVSGRDWGIVDTGDRVQKFLKASGSKARNYIVQLAESHDKAWSGNEDNFRKHLSEMFELNSPVRTSTDNFVVAVPSGAGGRKKFKLDKEAAARFIKAKDAPPEEDIGF